MTVDVDPSSGVVIKALHGPVTVDDLIACSRLLREHPEYSDAELALVDLDQASLELTYDDVSRVASHLRSDPCPGRWAIVASSDPGFGVARQMAARSDERQEVGVFRSRANAIAWLTAA